MNSYLVINWISSFPLEYTGTVFMQVFRQINTGYFCMCACAFLSSLIISCKYKHNSGRPNTHLHPNAQRRHSRESLNHTASLFLSICFSFSLFLYSSPPFLEHQQQAGHYNPCTISITYTESSLFSVCETVGGNSVIHSECCHSERSRDTFTV